MTGETPCRADFYHFAQVLGYTFNGKTAVGHCIRGPENPNKNKLQDLYLPGQAHVGKTKGLHPLYAQLVIIFSDNIAPSGGNNDAIRASLVDLLHFAHEVGQEERVGEDCVLDVMDFIFHEI